jgi:hypothetical protein
MTFGKGADYYSRFGGFGAERAVVEAIEQRKQPMKFVRKALSTPYAKALSEFSGIGQHLQLRGFAIDIRAGRRGGQFCVFHPS